MLTNAQIDADIRVLENEIANDKKMLERKAIKLELLRELRQKATPEEREECIESSATEQTTTQTAPPGNNGHGVAQPYSGMAPTSAILSYLNDMGGNAQMGAMLDVLSGQVVTTSSNPRNVLRTCARQLRERRRVEIEDDEISIVNGS